MNFPAQIPFRSPDERRLVWRSCAVALFFLILDQLTKALVVSLIPFRHQVTVIPRLFNLTYITNPGAAWGMLAGKGILLLLISLTVLCAILIFLRRITDGWPERYYALFLIISGIIGNSLDRVCRGEVVDFLQFYWLQMKYQWPSFNVADSCICCGVVLFILSTFLRPESPKTPRA